jgi:hypothetical protein
MFSTITQFFGHYNFFYLYARSKITTLLYKSIINLLSFQIELDIKLNSVSTHVFANLCFFLLLSQLKHKFLSRHAYNLTRYAGTSSNLTYLAGRDQEDQMSRTGQAKS